MKGSFAAVTGLAVALLGSGVVLAAASWTPATSLHVARTAFAAATLGDGSVLVVGGSPGSSAGSSAERYDPGTDRWVVTGSLATPRVGPTLAALPDGGAVVVGGTGPSGLLASAERYDATSGSWSDAGTLGTARTNHSMTVLADGRVLMAGGVSANGGATNEVEIFDPASNTWARAASLRNPRYNHSATLLRDGRVLVAGGFTPGSFHTATKKAEVYDPVADRWDVVAPMDEKRAVHAATLLADGRVLVAGGVSSPPNALVLTATAEVFDPARGAWTTVGSLGVARRAMSAVATGGAPMIVGGIDASGSLTATVERYDPSSETWGLDTSMSIARAPVLVRLLDGRILAIASIGRITIATVEVASP